MKVYIYGEDPQAHELLQKVQLVVEELGLGDFIIIEQTTDAILKESLDIQENFALIIEEESINFKDMIFEGIVPSDEDIKSMFVSIIGGGSTGTGCAPGGCASGDCSC